MSENTPPGYFNVHKYRDRREAEARTRYVSPTDSIAQGHQMVVSFRHEPSGESVFFKAFITSMTETYNCDWTEEAIYGRNDPTQIFKQTTRRISLGLKVPAETFGEAYDNLGRVGRLEQFLYPNYTPVGLGHTISQGPMVRMKVMNLIAKAGTQTAADATDAAAGGTNSNAASATSYGKYKSGPDSAKGLLGAITSLNVNHNLDVLEVNIFTKEKNTVLSGLIEINVDFVVVHEKRLGWDKDKFSDGVFPYGVTLMSEADEKAAAKQVKEEIAASVKPAPDAPGEIRPDQARLDAAARYANAMPGRVQQLTRDLKYLEKMRQKMAEGKALTAKEAANYAYLSSAISGVVSAAPESVTDRAIAASGVEDSGAHWADPGQAADVANILLEDFVP